MSSPEPPAVPELAQELADDLGIDEPDAAMVRRLQRALDDAEADVVGYLGRPILPEQHTAYRVWPDLFRTGGWTLAETEPIRRIVSATPETFLENGVPIETGTFTVVYEVGLDYANDPALAPIRRYVMAAALNSPKLLTYLSRTNGLRGPVKSVSVSTEGQSKNVTYADLGYGGGGQAGADSPGALPSRSSLDRWRRAGRRVHQAPDQPHDPRLYGTGRMVRDRAGFWNRT